MEALKCNNFLSGTLMLGNSLLPSALLDVSRRLQNLCLQWSTPESLHLLRQLTTRLMLEMLNTRMFVYHDPNPWSSFLHKVRLRPRHSRLS